MFSALIVAVFLAVPYWKKRYFSGGKGKKSDKNGGTGAAANQSVAGGTDSETSGDGAVSDGGEVENNA